MDNLADQIARELDRAGPQGDGRMAHRLAALGAPAVEPLLASLGHPSDIARCVVCDALGLIGERRALAELRRVVRAQSYDTIGGEFREPEHDCSPGAHAGQAIKAIWARHGIPAEDIATLIAELVLPDQYTWPNTASLLVHIGAPAVEPLLAALADPERAARAAYALGWIGDPRAIPALEAMEASEVAAGRRGGAFHDALHTIRYKLRWRR